MSNKKRINISFTPEQIKVIHSLNGIMGSSDSEIIRNITLAWLSEKNLLTQKIVSEINQNKIHPNINYNKKSKKIKNTAKSEEIVTRLIR